jgi:aspartate 1-decarboxylase
MRSLLRGKIHRATVTETNLEYVGSITIDKALMEKVDIWPGERVLVSDLSNGNRFETYAVEGQRGKGEIIVNGAAALLVNKGDKIIIMAFEMTDKPIKASVILVDEKNHFEKDL